MKKINLILILLVLLSIISTGFYLLFFDDNIAASKYTGIVNLVKRYNAGIIYNKTTRSVRFTDYKWIHTVSPGKDARDAGVFDADSIILDTPTIYNGKIYKNKVLKFCNLVSITVYEKDGKTIMNVQNDWICKIFNDFDFYDSIDEAFN